MTVRYFVLPAIIASLLLSCSGDAGEDRQSSATPGRSEAPAGAARESTVTIPEWVAKSRQWPDTMHWVFDSSLELTLDGLFLRVQPKVGLDLSDRNLPGLKPLISQTLVTMRPVADWAHAKGFKLDSLIVHDPVRGVTLPSQPLLSFERAYTEQTVRTTFVPNMATHQTPVLEDGQPIEITMHMSWDSRRIVAMFPPMRARHLQPDGSW